MHLNIYRDSKGRYVTRVFLDNYLSNSQEGIFLKERELYQGEWYSIGILKIIKELDPIIYELSAYRASTLFRVIQKAEAVPMEIWN